MLFGSTASASADAENAETRQIADAVIQAYSLEAEYWRDPRRFGSWDKLYAHYQRGFSPDIAEQMTEFTLDNDGDMATWVPQEVVISGHDGEFALAWFRTPRDFVDGPWGFQRYMVVRLRREDCRW
ncbi:MAG: hypothetical protein WBG92_25325, partial [Thiohalocapsa sp.]